MTTRGYDRIKPLIPTHRNHAGARISLYPESLDESTPKNQWPHAYAEVYCNQGKRDATNVADRMTAAWNATLGIPLDVLERLDVGRLVHVLQRYECVFGGIDNGYCRECGAHRLGDEYGRRQPCSNPNCLSNEIRDALGG